MWLQGGFFESVSDQEHADERRLLRTAKSCGPDAPTLASSSRRPAKAGDPVFRDVSDGIGKLRRTGYSAFAEYDDSLCSRRPFSEALLFHHRAADPESVERAHGQAGLLPALQARQGFLIGTHGSQPHGKSGIEPSDPRQR